MIPKKIHYCWLSKDTYPENIKKCMESWKRFLPDYEFIHWDKEKLDSLNSEWASQAFESKKYAFAADYIRCFAVATYGGIYLDTDVEVCGSFDGFLENKSFIGLDSRGDLEAAVFGAEPGCAWLKKALEFYKDRHFINPDGTFNTTTMPNVFKMALKNVLPPNSLKIKKVLDLGTITLYPYDFFSPKDYTTGLVKATINTITIHHFTGSWIDHRSIDYKLYLLKKFLIKLFGVKFIIKFLNVTKLSNLKNKIIK